MKSQTLYQRVLGQEFSKLPAILQQFHSLPEGGCAEGIIVVERGAGILRQAAAQLLRLPNPGGEMPLRLQVVPQDGKEIWIRRFGRQELRTVQWQEGAYLIEKAGPLHFAFRLAVDEHGLTFYLHSTRMRGLQVPDRMLPRVNANAQGMGDDWRIEVTIAAPLLGTVTTYKGKVTPQVCVPGMSGEIEIGSARLGSGCR